MPDSRASAVLIAAVELIFGYIITVAIQTAAGVAAIVSAIPELSDNKVLLTLGIITVLTYINLRGVKEAGFKCVTKWSCYMLLANNISKNRWAILTI
jgi:hypothetical protein